MSIQTGLGGTGGGAGAGGAGALLQQSDDSALGLFISSRKADASWHLRGVERDLEEAAVVASAEYIGASASHKLTLRFLNQLFVTNDRLFMTTGTPPSASEIIGVLNGVGRSIVLTGNGPAHGATIYDIRRDATRANNTVGARYTSHNYLEIRYNGSVTMGAVVDAINAARFGIGGGLSVQPIVASSAHRAAVVDSTAQTWHGVLRGGTAGVEYKPEGVNAFQITHSEYGDPGPEVKAYHDVGPLRVTSARTGDEGNRDFVTVEEGTPASPVRNAHADIEGSRGATPGHQGAIRVRSPNVAAVAASAFYTGHRTSVANGVEMAFHTTGADGNGIQVRFAFGGQGVVLNTVEANYTTVGGKPRLNVNLNNNVSYTQIAAAINGARRNGEQLVSAATRGNGATQVRWQSGSSVVRLTLAGGHGGTGAATNTGRVEVHRATDVDPAAAAVAGVDVFDVAKPGTAATGTLNLAPSGQTAVNITITADQVGDAISRMEMTVFRRDLLASQGIEVTFNAGSPASLTVLILGTVTAQAVVDAINGISTPQGNGFTASLGGTAGTTTVTWGALTTGVGSQFMGVGQPTTGVIRDGMLITHPSDSAAGNDTDVRVTRGDPALPATKASATVNVAPSGDTARNLTFTSDAAGAAGNNRNIFVGYDTALSTYPVGANTVAARITSSHLEIAINGTVTLNDIIAAVNTGIVTGDLRQSQAKNVTASLPSGVSGTSTVTWESGDSTRDYRGEYSGGADARRTPLAAAWNTTDDRLDITGVIATDTVTDVKNAIIALSQFADADVTFDSDVDPAADTLVLGTNVGDHLDYDFEDGADGGTHTISYGYDFETNVLRINALPTDTFDDVMDTVAASGRFQRGNGNSPGDLWLVEQALTTDTIDTPASTSDAALMYPFAGGAAAVARSELEAFDSNTLAPDSNLLIRGVIAGDTVADIIAAYAGDDFTLSAPGGDTSAALSASDVVDSVNQCANGRDLVTRSLPRVQLTNAAGHYLVNYHGPSTAAGNRTTLAEMRDAWASIQNGRPSPMLAITGTAGSRISSVSPRPIGGSNYVPEGDIEALVRPDDEANGPNVEVRYHADHDTLDEIAIALDAQGAVEAVEVYGTDLSVLPEDPPFRRAMFQGGGESTSGAQALTDAQIGDKAFSNPPGDLTAGEKQAAREAIGAGTGTGTGGLDEVESDETLSGVGTSGDPLSVAAPMPPFPSAGSRHKRAPVFDDDVLRWELIATDDDAKLGIFEWTGSDESFIDSVKLAQGNGNVATGDKWYMANSGSTYHGDVLRRNGTAFPASDLSASDIPTYFDVLHTSAAAGAGQRPFIQYSNDQSNWSDSYTAGNAYMRIAVGTTKPADGSSDWSSAIRIIGPSGPPGPQGPTGARVYLQYSADDSAWHDTLVPASDEYIRFAIHTSKPGDGDSRWSDGVKFKGEDGADGSGGTGGLSAVASDATLTGDGTSGDPLAVANPFTDADETKLDAIAAGAQVNPAKASNADVDAETDDADYMTVAKVFRAIGRKVKAATTAAAGIVRWATGTEIDTGTATNRAVTPAGLRRATGTKVNSTEKTSGAATTVRRFSPRDVHDMIDTHAPSTPGPAGAAGRGVPVGGALGEVLAKASAADYDTAWVVQAAAAAGGEIQQITGRITQTTGRNVAAGTNPILCGLLDGTAPYIFLSPITVSGRDYAVHDGVGGGLIPLVSLGDGDLLSDLDTTANSVELAAGTYILGFSVNNLWMGAKRSGTARTAPEILVEAMIAGTWTFLGATPAYYVRHAPRIRATTSFNDQNWPVATAARPGATVSETGTTLTAYDGTASPVEEALFTVLQIPQALEIRFRLVLGFPFFLGGSSNPGTFANPDGTHATSAGSRVWADDTLARQDLIPSPFYADVPQITVISIGGAGGELPAVHPHVSSFSLTSGDLHPEAGDDIAGTYGYSFETSQSSHITAARIIGFTGTDVNPTSPTVLATIAAANYHDGTGSITIPSTILAAANDVYTVRLEAYEEGQTPGTDLPISYKDVRIVAHTPAVAFYHWGRIPYVSDSESAADGAARVVFANHDLVTGNALASGYEAEPDTTGNWIFYLAVKSDQVQPTGWTSNNLPATGAFRDAVDRTISSVDYKFYVLDPQLYRTHSDGSITYNPTTG